MHFQMHSHSTWFDRHNSALDELLAIACERHDRRRALLFRPEGHQSHDSAVRLPADDDDLPEVLVESDEHLSVAVGVCQDLSVSWIPRPIGSRFDLVSGSGERIAGAAPDTAIEQDLHTQRFVSAGSIRSCPTTRRA